MEIGIQVSSFRPVLTTAAEVDYAFRAMARMGCSLVQLQWISPDVSPEEIAVSMTGAGLRSAGVQDFYTEVAKNEAYYTRLNALTGGRWVCVGRIPEEWKTRSGLNKYAQALRSMARRLESAGQALCFHPVAADFAEKDGLEPVETLLEILPELMLCADLYHVWKSGRDMCQWLEQYAGRVVMVHFKDCRISPDGTETLVPVGQGGIRWSGAAEACVKTGVKYAFAEQERWEGDPFERLNEGFSYLQSVIG